MAKKYIDREVMGEEAQEELENIIKSNRTAELEGEVEKLKKIVNQFLVPIHKEMKKQGTEGAKGIILKTIPNGWEAKIN